MPSSLQIRAMDKQPWKRLRSESSQAWEAFEMFRLMGNARRLSKVSEELNKSRQLISRWAARYAWHDRVSAYDQAEAKALDAATLATKAKLRAKLVEAAADVIDLPPLSLDEKQHLSVIERSVLLKTAATIAEGDELDERGGDPRFLADMQPPTFTIQVIRPGYGPDGSKMIGVQLPDGRYGYIPQSRVDEARRDHPDWVFIL